ncbi:MAG: hypothetical protein EOP64_00230 [Sphingomonas sp.]|nr:MAG: hypothetical protein EOP64_00230 [Sphingomonas sp.]
MSVTRRAIRKRMHRLFTGELSFVDAPANERPFLVAKRRKTMPADKAEQEVIDRMRKMPADVEDKLTAFLGKQRVSKLAGSDQERTLTPGATAALRAAGRILAAYADELSDEDMLALMVELGMVPPQDADAASEEEAASLADDSAEADEPQGEDATEAAQLNAPEPGEAADVTGDEAEMAPSDASPIEMDKPDAVSDADHDKAMQVAMGAYNQKLKDGMDAEQAKAAAKDAYLEALSKAGYTVEKRAKSNEDRMPANPKAPSSQTPDFSAGQRAFIETLLDQRLGALTAENKTLVEKNAKLHDEVKVEREDRLGREYAAKAAEFKHLGEQGEIAAMLKSAHGNEAETTRLTKVLNAANAQAEQAHKHGSLFNEYGSKLPAGQRSAESELTDLVGQIVEKSAGDSQLTHQQAYAKALQTQRGRELYNKFQAGVSL